MAEMHGMTREEPLATSRDVAGGSVLLPRAVRRWVIGGLVVLVGSAAYLIAVRGTAILFDLRDAVSALCM